MVLKEGKRYFFRKDYDCEMGRINEGRELNFYRGHYLMDGMIVMPPYDKVIEKMMADDKLFNEYIVERDFQDSRFVI